MGILDQRRTNLQGQLWPPKLRFRPVVSAHGWQRPQTGLQCVEGVEVLVQGGGDLTVAMSTGPQEVSHEARLGCRSPGGHGF